MAKHQSYVGRDKKDDDKEDSTKDIVLTDPIVEHYTSEPIIEPIIEPKIEQPVVDKHARIKEILKKYGMDSMQQQKAYDEIVNLV